MKDNFLYLARAANCGLLSYIKQSSIGNVPTETITTLVALISPGRAHCTNTARKAVCARRLKAPPNRTEAFIMFGVGLQMLRELPDSRQNVSYAAVFADLHPL